MCHPVTDETIRVLSWGGGPAARRWARKARECSLLSPASCVLAAKYLGRAWDVAFDEMIDDPDLDPRDLDRATDALHDARRGIEEVFGAPLAHVYDTPPAACVWPGASRRWGYGTSVHPGALDRCRARRARRRRTRRGLSPRNLHDDRYLEPLHVAEARESMALRAAGDRGYL
jgi:hypothetical protein